MLANYLPDLPSHVVLDTRETVWQFKRATEALEVAREPAMEHVVAGIFELLHEREKVNGYVSEYVQDTYAHLNGRTTAQVESYCESLRQLCWGLYDSVEAARLYSSHGVLWFDFDRLLGADTVLRLGEGEICT